MIVEISQCPATEALVAAWAFEKFTQVRPVVARELHELMADELRLEAGPLTGYKQLVFGTDDFVRIMEEYFSLSEEGKAEICGLLRELKGSADLSLLAVRAYHRGLEDSFRDAFRAVFDIFHTCTWERHCRKVTDAAVRIVDLYGAIVPGWLRPRLPWLLWQHGLVLVWDKSDRTLHVSPQLPRTVRLSDSGLAEKLPDHWVVMDRIAYSAAPVDADDDLDPEEIVRAAGEYVATKGLRDG